MRNEEWEEQESSIYFDGTDLNITLNEPSQAGVINLTDNVNIEGELSLNGNIDLLDNNIINVDTIRTNRLIADGNISINSDASRLYFGTNQDSSIYFDGEDLNITLNEPSQAGLIRITDSVVHESDVDLSCNNITNVN